RLVQGELGAGVLDSGGDVGVGHVAATRAAAAARGETEDGREGERGDRGAAGKGMTHGFSWGDEECAEEEVAASLRDRLVKAMTSNVSAACCVRRHPWFIRVNCVRRSSPGTPAPDRAATPPPSSAACRTG